jgi:secretion/DNA translocation related CpaE-like protein
VDGTWESSSTPGPARAFVLGVVGARGGAGTSSFAAALADRAAGRTATALVDLDHAGGGIDVLLGVEREAGARWPDVAGARGARGEDVLALLPRWRGCAVLSADRTSPAPPDGAVAADVVAALASCVGVVVLDLDRAAVVGREPVVRACDAVVVVVPLELRAVAGALALRPALLELVGRAGLVARWPAPGGLGAAELEDAIALPLVARLPHVRGLAAVAERAGLQPGGGSARAAAAAWRALLPGGPP